MIRNTHTFLLIQAIPGARPFILLLFILSVFRLNAQTYITYSPNDENIQYQGRINFSNPAKPVFAYPGISIKAKFQGTDVKVKLNGGAGSSANYFNVFIDGEFVKKFELQDEMKNEICQTGMDDTIHTVEVTKRTESFCGKVEFLGFEIAGELLPPDPLPLKKIQFIGNSITCGYGNEDVPTNGFTSDKENNYLAYGAVCARELNAQYQAIAYSGRGVAFNWACSEGDVVPVIYEKYFADDELTPENQYDHTSYIPDLIVINLGTNDHSCDQLTDQNFKEPYVNFIATLKSYFPDVKILCLTGPMNSSDAFRTRVQDIVNTSGGADQGIYYFDQTHIIGIAYAGGHWHPNTQMADINGKEVAAFIWENNLLGISATSEPATINIQDRIFPNPVTSGQPINIDLTSIHSQQPIQVKIIDLYGKTIQNYLLKPGQRHQIPTENLKGFYFATAKSQTKIYGGTFIVN